MIYGFDIGFVYRRDLTESVVTPKQKEKTQFLKTLKAVQIKPKVLKCVKNRNYKRKSKWLQSKARNKKS